MGGTRRDQEPGTALAERLDAIERLARLGWWSWDLARNVCEWSEAAIGIIGMSGNANTKSPESLAARLGWHQWRFLSMMVAQISSDGSVFEADLKLEADGRGERWINLRCQPSAADRRLVWGIVQDVTDRRRRQLEIEDILLKIVGRQHERLEEGVTAARFEATHDPLTRLPNRRFLRDHLSRLTEMTRVGERLVAVFCVDVDGFKGVNDRHGHAAGDQVLCAVADHLLQCTRDSDVAARIGGDEFVLVMELPPSERSLVGDIAARIVDLHRHPSDAPGFDAISLSVGVSLYPEDSDDIGKVVAFADAALYEAKRTGKMRFVTYRGIAEASSDD